MLILQQLHLLVQELQFQALQLLLVLENLLKSILQVEKFLQFRLMSQYQLFQPVYQYQSSLLQIPRLRLFQLQFEVPFLFEVLLPEPA